MTSQTLRIHCRVDWNLSREDWHIRNCGRDLIIRKLRLLDDRGIYFEHFTRPIKHSPSGLWFNEYNLLSDWPLLFPLPIKKRIPTRLLCEEKKKCKQSGREIPTEWQKEMAAVNSLQFCRSLSGGKFINSSNRNSCIINATVQINHSSRFSFDFVVKWNWKLLNSTKLLGNDREFKNLVINYPFTHLN